MFFYDGTMLHLGNFVKVRYVEHDLIIVDFAQYELEIYGESLRIVQLADDEMFIQGEVKELDLKHAA